MTALLAAVSLGGMSVAQIAIAVIVIVFVVAVVVIFVKNSGITIPPWVVQILWLVVLLFVAIVAILIGVSFVGGT